MVLAEERFPEVMALMEQVQVAEATREVLDLRDRMVEVPMVPVEALDLVEIPEPVVTLDQVVALDQVATLEPVEALDPEPEVEAKILLQALLPKRLAVVTVTRMALDSASREIATENPSTASSPGWWRF